MKKFPLLIRIICYLCFLGAVTFLLLEIALTVTNIPIQKTVFEYDSEMGFRVIPYEHNSNYFGFNDKDYALEKPSDVYRIVVLGDSFNWIGGRKHNYVQYLQEIFEREMPDQKIEVINAGYMGTHTGEQLVALKKYAIQYQPDLLVLGFFAGNDFFDADPGRKTIVVNGLQMQTQKNRFYNYKYFPLVLKSRATTYVYQKLKQKSAIPKKPKKGTFEESVFLNIEKQRMRFYAKDREEREKFSRNVDYAFSQLDQMSDYVKERDIQFFVGIFPDQFSVDEKLSTQLFKKYNLNPEDFNLEYAQEILKSHLNQKDIPFVDITPIFKEKAKQEDLYLLHDTHWNPRGAKIAANKIFEKIKPIVEEDLRSRIAS